MPDLYSGTNSLSCVRATVQMLLVVHGPYLSSTIQHLAIDLAHRMGSVNLLSSRKFLPNSMYSIYLLEVADFCNHDGRTENKKRFEALDYWCRLTEPKNSNSKFSQLLPDVDQAQTAGDYFLSPSLVCLHWGPGFHGQPPAPCFNHGLAMVGRGQGRGDHKEWGEQRSQQGIWGSQAHCWSLPCFFAGSLCLVLFSTARNSLTSLKFSQPLSLAHC